MTLLNASEAIAAGVVIALDRQEQTGGDAAVRMSAIQGVEKEFNIPVCNVVRLEDLIGYLAQQNDCQEQLEAVSAYRAQYGV